VTISSGLCRLIPISDPPFPNYTGGSLQWGRITFKDGDELVHGRTMSLRIKRLGMTYSEYAKSLGFEQLPRVHLKRHKYLMPLDRKMRRQIEPLAKKYPAAAPQAEKETPA